MLDFTVRAALWMLSIVMPNPRGRHRAQTLAAPHPALRITPPPALFTELIDGSASPLVRPYVLTQDERRLQRERRRALCLATLGIDTGPHHIHGVRVGAAR
ncbi:hypothetical protein SGFS_045670 [Streptomyces graminofaciens]|uniref:Secreted protein n=1 Tax=Streptomyces graminofaciens TaxID=68212 RepID=A0ABN5VJM0_9ACTN|nr:hypothetical protein [Streptomyces graminofaciens]BBC33273.1 hypothetical protein SGFS_045670 [Streptomyces graminofaciens]